MEKPITTETQSLNFKVLVQNMVAALTVSFVAISLGAAFGILSERGAFVGMLSAGVIALITSLLGGTRVQCSGPTAPMTAVTVLVVAAAYGAVQEQMPGVNPDHFINIAIFMTAALLLLGALLRLGRYINYVPNVVVSGFMNGIAVLIWIDQIHKLFGFGGKTSFGGSLGQNLTITLMSLAMLFLLPVLINRIMPKVASLFSATLATIVVMSTVTQVLSFDIEMVSLSARLESWGDITALVAAQWPQQVSAQLLWLAFPFALQLGLLAYLDTMLTSLVVDKMTKETTKANKELMAQGLAQGAVALFGGIPGAQATIRSVLMIKEKASLRLSGIMVGVFVIVEIILFQDAISLIPQAVFAGVLIKVGYDVFDWMPVRLYIKELLAKKDMPLVNFFSRHDDEPIYVMNTEMIIIIGTTLTTILWNLNMAVFLFTGIFYLYNRVLNKTNPMRDLRMGKESDAFGGDLFGDELQDNAVSGDQTDK